MADKDSKQNEEQASKEPTTYANLVRFNIPICTGGLYAS